MISIHSLVLAYFATKVNYNLTSGKAIVVVILPVVVLLVGAIRIGGLIASVMVAGMNG